MSKYLFLDDVRNPSDVKWVKLPVNVKWDIVRDYGEFTDYILKHGIPQFVAYDHDLADVHYSKQSGEINYDEFNEKTGYDCAKFLINICASKNIEHPRYVVHSLNPIGGANIRQIIDRYNNTFNIF